MMLAQAAGYIFLDFYTPKLSLSLSLSASPPHLCAHTHHVPNLAPGPMLRALLSWSAVIINPTAAIRHCSISLQTQRCLITRICHLINADTTCETELLRSTLQLFEYLTLWDLPPALAGYTAAFPESDWEAEWLRSDPEHEKWEMTWGS